MASHYYGRAMSADSGAPVASPFPIPVASTNSLPAFLVKTYDIVEDPTTDKIISWSATANSFIVWNPPELERDILPNFFKHKNFTSFVRQLNTYGFRKVDPDEWEFANDGFLRGRKDLLKNINRQTQIRQQPNVPCSSSVGACVEVGKFGLEEEVEKLKRDKNVLMQEVVRMRQQQQSTEIQLQKVVLTVHEMEQRQQRMLFLVNAVNSPGLLSQFVQLQSDHNKLITEGSKKRRFKKDAANVVPVDDGQVVKYQPRTNEAALAMVRQFLELDSSPISGNFSDDFLTNSSVSMMNSYNHISELTLQEAPLSSRQPFIAPVSSAAFQSPSPSLIPETRMPPSVIDMPPLPQLQSSPSNPRCDTSRDGNSPLEIDEDEINWDDMFTDSEALPGSADPFWDPVFMDSLQKMSDDDHDY